MLYQRIVYSLLNKQRGYLCKKEKKKNLVIENVLSFSTSSIRPKISKHFFSKRNFFFE